MKIFRDAIHELVDQEMDRTDENSDGETPLISDYMADIIRFFNGVVSGDNGKGLS